MSPKAYIEKVLRRFKMKDCVPSVAPIIKKDRFNKDQYPQNILEQEQMKIILNAFAVCSLMYAQVFTSPNIELKVGLMGQYQSNLGLEHWRAANRVLRHFQGTKDYSLTYVYTNYLKVIGYSNSDFPECVDNIKTSLGYIFLITKGISYKCSKQTIVAMFTMEVEFIACYDFTTHAL